MKKKRNKRKVPPKNHAAATDLLRRLYPLDKMDEVVESMTGLGKK